MPAYVGIERGFAVGAFAVYLPCLAFILSFFTPSLLLRFLLISIKTRSPLTFPFLSMSPSAASTTIPFSFLTTVRSGGAMIRSIIRISALMTAGRGWEIRDLVAKGDCGD